MNLASLIGSGVIMLHTRAIQKMGLDEALVLAFLNEKWVKNGFGEFYYTINKLADDTALSERNCRAIIKELIDEKILIKKDFKGIPPKQYYTINEIELLKVVKGE